MNLINTQPVVESTCSIAREADDPLADAECERYTSTAAEPNIAPVPFDDRIDLETRVYGIVLGAISSGMLGWLWIYASAGVSFLLS